MSVSVGAQKLREALSPKFTQAEFAEKLGVTKQAIHAWLSGNARPTADKMAKIEDLTGIPMRAWAEGVPAEEVETEEPAGAPSEEPAAE